jgi:hypothetical protein
VGDGEAGRQGDGGAALATSGGWGQRSGVVGGAPPYTEKFVRKTVARGIASRKKGSASRRKKASLRKMEWCYYG